MRAGGARRNPVALPALSRRFTGYGMRRVWLISNPGSGSVAADALSAVEQAFDDAGAVIAGRTEFPTETLPDATALDGCRVDTVAVFGGDGTINAVVSALDAWPGVCLPLPGGTMNVLPRQLHGDAAAPAIVAAAASAEPVCLPQVECGEHRALCGIIAGPAASWVHAREAWRAGRPFHAVSRALKLGWQRSFGSGLRVLGRDTPGGRHRAIVLTPRPDGVEVAAIAAWRWGQVLEFGWLTLTGEWRDASFVAVATLPEVAIGGARSATILFDGEKSKLPLPLKFIHGQTRLKFLPTLTPPKDPEPL